MSSYYSLLCCDESDSYEAVKAAYHAFLRRNHPDKLESSVGDAGLLEVAKQAWITLSDRGRRGAYDVWLREQRLAGDSCVVGESVSAAELAAGERVQCRCGAVFAVADEQLERLVDRLYVPCAGCSLYLRVCRQ